MTADAFDMSPDAVFQRRQALWGNGYRPYPIWSPGARDHNGEPVKNAGKRACGANWLELANVNPPLAARQRPDTVALNTGIVLGEAVVIDVDVEDESLVNELVGVIRNVDGATPLCRQGRPPKLAFIYRTDRPYSKIKTPELKLPNGTKAVVEVLARGQGLTIDGIHPQTGAPYRFLGEANLLNTAVSELPQLSELRARAVIEEVERVLREAGAVDWPKAVSLRGAASLHPAENPLTGGFFHRVNQMALHHPEEWLPSIYPDAKRAPNGTFRIPAAMRGLPASKQDLSIHPELGIVDWADNERPMTAIDFVLAHGSPSTSYTAPRNRALTDLNVAARLEALAEPGGICVSAIVHDQVQGRLDCGFKDIGDQQLKNIARPVRVYRVGISGVATAVDAAPALPLPDKPSIAVLPFQNMSGDPEQEYFADGMVEEIITALSRIRWLFVIARNSSFTYKGQAVDVKQVGRELGVRYVLEGSVRKGSGRVRITAQLIEAESGAHLWADRFDGSLEDVFDLQDQVATSVAGVIEPALQAAEISRSSARPTDDLTAYDLYLRGVLHAFRYGKDDALDAIALFDRALQRDPRYAPALARASLCFMQLSNGGWTDDPEQTRQNGISYARRAVEADNGDPEVLSSAAHTLGVFGGDLSVMMTMIERSLELNPSHAWGWSAAGWNRLWAGEPDAAIHHFETALRLSPREPRRLWWVTGIGVAHFLAKRFDEALPKLLPAIEEHRTWPTPYRFLAASYAHLGRLDEARSIVERLRAVASNLMTAASLRRPEDAELLLSGLRLAMGET
jgi:adenylate cyclase